MFFAGTAHAACPGQYTSLHLGAATVTVYGLSGDDDIQGSPLNALNYLEALYGDDGADTIRGEGGTDEIHGGAGPDILWGGGDADEMYGDAGNDQMKGEDGEDYMDGGADTDQVCGGNDDDEVHGGTGNDTLYAGAGYAANQYVYEDSGTDDCGHYTSATITCGGTHAISACPW